MTFSVILLCFYHPAVSVNCEGMF